MSKRTIAKADMTPDEREVFDILERLADRGLLHGAAEVCRRHHASVEQAVGRSRSKSIVRARVAMWRWLGECGFSTAEIGVLVNRGHAGIGKVIRGSAHGSDRRLGAVGLIAAWLEAECVADEDPRAFVDVVDRSRIADLIRNGAWRR